MRHCAVWLLWFPGVVYGFAQPPTAAHLAADLQQIAVDAADTYRVRNLSFSRGDIKLYLNEGAVSFAKPIDGRKVAVIFTAQNSEGGDGEILLLPPTRSERASLASFIKSPNLNEHFRFAAFVFSDTTEAELRAEMNEAPLRPAPEVATANAETINAQLRAVVEQSALPLIQALLDQHAPEAGFFYGFFAGEQLGLFDVFYDPSEPEAIQVGQPVGAKGGDFLKLWTSFRPRHAIAAAPSPNGISDYRIDTAIGRDLQMKVKARFRCETKPTDGRVMSFGLSNHLRVTSARIDGRPAEVFQRDSLDLAERQHDYSLLLVADAPLSAGIGHSLEVDYEGSVIRHSGNGGYFVDDRNEWYPHLSGMRTDFDLTFRFPAPLTLVSTGGLVEDRTDGEIREVHRRTSSPEGLAGFNLGDYKSSLASGGPYRVESYAEKHSSAESAEAVAQKTAAVLEEYSKRWLPLPIHSLAVTPIAGTFGQGFPGLIYLSDLAYMRAQDRPPDLRNARLDTFFSEMMLPHEVAHQWWGNEIISADYRSDWLMEAMANYAALQTVEKTRGRAAMNAVLDSYRADLLGAKNGQTVEATGPLDFGVRLFETAGLDTWHKIIYEKGSWVLHMLRERLGDEGFRQMQVALLTEYAAQPLTNDALRRVAARFVPVGQPDRDFSLFFDTWVYGTGLPRLDLVQTAEGPSLEVAKVEADYQVDVPLACRTRGSKTTVVWIRGEEGSTPLERLRRGSTCELPESSSFLYSR